MLSREAQLRVEQQLHSLRHGYTCNVWWLYSWTGQLEQGTCHQDTWKGVPLDALVRQPARWEGVLGVKPTYEEITIALRANVLSLIEIYFERVLMMVTDELRSAPLLAAEFNGQLTRVGDFLAAQCPGLIEEADGVLRTDFAAQPPPVSIEAVLQKVLSRRLRRDYAGELFGETAGTAKPAVAPKSPGRKQFPKRAEWLNSRLRDMGWNESDPCRWGGPDRKTVQRILRGEAVGNAVLKKLADALSKPAGSVLVKPSEIPTK